MYAVDIPINRILFARSLDNTQSLNTVLKTSPQQNVADFSLVYMIFLLFSRQFDEFVKTVAKYG